MARVLERRPVDTRLGLKKVICLHDHVAILPSKVTLTQGGVALPDPDTWEQGEVLKLKSGTVAAVGRGTYLESGELMSCETKVGWTVEYYSYATRGARSRIIDGVEYDFVKDQDVAARIEG